MPKRNRTANEDEEVDVEESNTNGASNSLLELFGQYTTKKSLSNILMDFALLAYNAAQLRVLFIDQINQRDALWVISLVCVIISILAQLVMGILLGILAKDSNTDDVDEDKQQSIDTMNNVVLALTAVVSALNIAINIFIQVDLKDLLPKKG